MRLLIRPYTYGDDGQISALINEATMFTVARFFVKTITREITAQLMLMAAACIFIVIGLPLAYCLLSIPLTMVTVYIGVFAAHKVKAYGHHQDLKNIEETYLANERTGFWVAELIEGSAADSKVEAFTADESTAPCSSNSRNKIVGTIAVDIIHDPYLKEPPNSVAWIRRYAYWNICTHDNNVVAPLHLGCL